MILILKDKDSIWMASSIENTFGGVNTKDILLPDNLKMWRPLDKAGAIMATTGVAQADALRYTDFMALNAPLTQTSMIRNILPTAKALLKDQGRLNGNRLCQEIAVAKDDKAFVATTACTVLEVEDFAAIGYPQSEEVALGAARLCRDLPPIERITEIFHTIERADKSVHFPVVIMNTRSDERIVIYE